LTGSDTKCPTGCGQCQRRQTAALADCAVENRQADRRLSN
jgi:hypothetical protein